MRSARIDFDHADPDRFERELVAVVMDQLRPALHALFRDLQSRVESLVGEAVSHQLGRGGRAGRIGEVKRCSVCGLEGARNLATLGLDHSLEEHQRARLKSSNGGRKRGDRHGAAAAASPRDQLRVAG